MSLRKKTKRAVDTAVFKEYLNRSEAEQAKVLSESNGILVVLFSDDAGGVRLGLGWEAFADDPYIAYFIPDPSERKEKTKSLFRFLVKYGVLYGEVYATWVHPFSKTASIVIHLGKYSYEGS